MKLSQPTSLGGPRKSTNPLRCFFFAANLLRCFFFRDSVPSVGTQCLQGPSVGRLYFFFLRFLVSSCMVKLSKDWGTCCGITIIWPVGMETI